MSQCAQGEGLHESGHSHRLVGTHADRRAASTAASRSRSRRRSAPCGRHGSARTPRCTSCYGPVTGPPASTSGHDCFVVVGAQELTVQWLDQASAHRAGREVDRRPRERERAFQHRAVGRRVDARGRELGLVVDRTAALSMADARDVSTASRSETIRPCRWRRSSPVLVIGCAAERRPRWRDRDRDHVLVVVHV